MALGHERLHNLNRLQNKLLEMYLLYERALIKVRSLKDSQTIRLL
jgi:hypothetical protein